MDPNKQNYKYLKCIMCGKTSRLLFSFPYYRKSEMGRKSFRQWVLFVEKSGVNWKKYHTFKNKYLCSIHFTDDQFYTKKRRKLLPCALPTLNPAIIENTIDLMGSYESLPPTKHISDIPDPFRTELHLQNPAGVITEEVEWYGGRCIFIKEEPELDLMEETDQYRDTDSTLKTAIEEEDDDDESITIEIYPPTSGGEKLNYTCYHCQRKFMSLQQLKPHIKHCFSVSNPCKFTPMFISENAK